MSRTYTKNINLLKDITSTVNMEGSKNCFNKGMYTLSKK